MDEFWFISVIKTSLLPIVEGTCTTMIIHYNYKAWMCHLLYMCYSCLVLSHLHKVNKNQCFQITGKKNIIHNFSKEIKRYIIYIYRCKCLLSPSKDGSNLWPLTMGCYCCFCPFVVVCFEKKEG